jgi:hypothetical protein
MSGTYHGYEPFADFSGPIRPPADSERRVLSISEVAKYCGVESEEVLEWIATGRLVACYVPPGGYRIAVGDFLTFFSRYTFLI